MQFSESGLIHLRARAYDPATGMFLQPDILGLGGGQMNIYAYAHSDPVNMTDPSGLAAYLDYKAGIDGRKQMLGSATRTISEGVFSKLIDIFSQLESISDFGSVLDVPGISPPNGTGAGHCNNKNNQMGSHVYTIYSRNTGRTLKVGISNNSNLIAEGTQSKRALAQITDPRVQAHIVLLKTPDGVFSRGLALALEKAMVQAISIVFGWDYSDMHKRPLPEHC